MTPSRSKDDEQHERFRRTAEELGVEMDEGKLKEALRRMKEPKSDEDKR